MGQMGFFDIANRYAGLDAKNDPLVKIDEVVPWEDCQSASKIDPQSACNIDPPERHGGGCPGSQ